MNAILHNMAGNRRAHWKFSTDIRFKISITKKPFNPIEYQIDFYFLAKSYILFVFFLSIF